MSERIKFYTDEHVHPAVVAGLLRRGIDVLTPQKAKMLGATDMEHLALAKNQCRVVFTQDDDFLRLHAQGVNHAGIVYARQQMPIGDIIRGLMPIYHVLDTGDMQNHIEFL
ncbi:MAG: DUF5615 family PIN-like protein [bacterium]